MIIPLKDYSQELLAKLKADGHIAKYDDQGYIYWEHPDKPNAKFYYCMGDKAVTA